MLCCIGRQNSHTCITLLSLLTLHVVVALRAGMQGKVDQGVKQPPQKLPGKKVRAKISKHD
eukprot:1154318-Pelagomonas_calceolata.AAC.6